MKSTESTTTAAHVQTKKENNQSFFSKESGGSAVASEKPFFSSSSGGGDTFFKPQTQPHSSFIQPKLTVGAPNDLYEKEADVMANKVVQRMAVGSGPQVQMKCAECEQEKRLQKKEGEEEESIMPQIQKKSIFESNEAPPGSTLQAKSDSPPPSEASPDLESRLSASRGSGHALPENTRGSMESAFGTDFSSVRVHTGSEAVQMNRELGAQAFTHGSDLYFGSGKYDPGSTEGNRLLGHELTHVVQQGSIQQSKAVPTLQMADECGLGHHRIWGGFKIEGDCAFVIAVRADLNRINATSIGSSLLSWVTTSRSGFFSSLVPIRFGSPGYIPGRIYYNPSFIMSDTCATGARSAPNYVYLFHEIVHLWLDEFKGYSTHLNRECMATGLGSYFTSLNYNENKLRCELGLHLRPCYGSECSSFRVPTSCI